MTLVIESFYELRMVIKQPVPLRNQLVQLLIISCSLLMLGSGCSGGNTSHTDSGVIETIVEVDKTDEVDETTDQNPTLIVLPSLIELTPADASHLLSSSGHIGQSTTDYNRKCSFSNGQGKIYQQDPLAGAKVDQSAHITVYTGCFSLKMIVDHPRGGTTSPPAGISDVKAYDDMIFSVSPEEGNSIEVTIDGELIAPESTNIYTIEKVTTDHIVVVNFIDPDISGNSSSSSDTAYTITTTVQSGDCSISPSGNVSVFEGLDQTFTISVNSGTLSLLQVDGVAQQCAANGCNYTFTTVSSDHAMEVLCL
jgi:hypothetical protein